MDVPNSFWDACPVNFTLAHKKCYRLENVTMSFDSARGFCESIGTRLFEPSYSVEDAAVRTEIFANGDQMPTWLGFMDALNEGV